MLRFFPLFLFLATGLSAQPQNPFTVPEYAPSKAVLVEWDFNDQTWDLYSELIAHCQEAVEVICVVRDANEENDMSQRLAADGVPGGNISFVYVPCERMWIRDHGPFAVQTDNGTAFMDFNDKADSGLDENLPSNLAAEWNYDVYARPWIFDGGNLLVDNHGTLFCTRGLYDNNPGMTSQQISLELEDFMGINRVVALKRQHDDYWGHIDMQAKLLDDSTFVLSSVSFGHPNYDSLEYNFQLLAALETHEGKPYRIRRLPHADDWKTYANALILNNTVIVPVYDHPNDAVAVATYAELLPNHTIKTLNCNKIIGWEGALHCITMQLYDENNLVSTEAPSSLPELRLAVVPNPVVSGTPVGLKITGGSYLPCTVSINDALGRLRHREHFLQMPDEHQFDANLKPGLYYIQVQNEQSVVSVPFVVHQRP
ncbi:MAG: agmatine deiminase family protein [Saprospiraceae bacterium]|nr:agmatine deiminase family protein [Saprospiraceae bacterium]